MFWDTSRQMAQGTAFIVRIGSVSLFSRTRMSVTSAFSSRGQPARISVRLAAVPWVLTDGRMLLRQHRKYHHDNEKDRFRFHDHSLSGTGAHTSRMKTASRRHIILGNLSHRAYTSGFGCIPEGLLLIWLHRCFSPSVSKSLL